MNDVKFSVAIHILVMIATSSVDVNSIALAQSVGTNPSYIRKILSLLKKRGLIESHRGKSGISLVKRPKDISLLTIYEAVEEQEPTFFQIHQHANRHCPVGKNIKEMVFPIESKLEKQISESLASENLADVIERLGKLIEKEN
ncbi:Rrf2 family transcriptional regulator [Lactobacillus sp. PV034]|uniref:Rrf2 family transcriptional regulator n=1 Tax=Lactobacillus sp. PV034 TaxID=2594495 RepID=UPI002240AA04|nr:Rrf2 family transcriptional regulator [Lactobacillus sp. PV034]QNQ80086.1 Rrf2 family transcriptional regulator [Lactobacillus sp. PV034]